MNAQMISHHRLGTMLRTAMGPVLANALKDPNVFEIMVNPDGSVRLDRQGEGRSETGSVMSVADIERVIRLVASHVRTELDADRPIVSGELPNTSDGLGGERFEGLLPPVVNRPCFSIRKPAYRLFRLGDYVTKQIMGEAEADFLRNAVRDKRNILVSGGTSSGKTTLTNALLAEIAELSQRVILIEDTRELKCDAADLVALRTRPGFVTMTDLVRSTLRLRPDRIVVGEVRGGEALDMLKAWNTGHPGGLATVHANSSRGALLRMEQLVQEVVTNPPKALVAEAIDVVVHLRGENAATGEGRRVSEIAEVTGLDTQGDYQLRSLFSTSLQISQPAGTTHA